MTQINDFGTTPQGTKVQSVDIAGGDLRARFLTYGACLNDLRMAGVDHPLTPGSPELAAYLGPLAYHGTLIGPVANRIRGASVVIDGAEFQLPRHDGQNFTLHSGPRGTQFKLWDIADYGPDFVEFSITLPDCCDGFPGNRVVQARFQLQGNNLSMTITAHSDEPTAFNFANHSFWTLDPTPGFRGQTLRIAADHVTDVNDMLCPTGQQKPVDQAGLDFRNPRVLAGSDAEFIDHNFCTAPTRQPLRDVAVLTGRQSGVSMTMASSEPGLQVYDCGTIECTGFKTHHGVDYPLYHALALEAQNWPDATTHAGFPSAITTPGVPYVQTTCWRFDKN